MSLDVAPTEEDGQPVLYRRTMRRGCKAPGWYGPALFHHLEQPLRAPAHETCAIHRLQPSDNPHRANVVEK